MAEVSRETVIENIRSNIKKARKGGVAVIDESGDYGNLLHEVLIVLADRLDLSVKLVFSYSGLRFSAVIPPGSNHTRYLEGNKTNIEALVDSFGASIEEK